MTLAVARIERWTDLGCVSGAQRFATGGFVTTWSAGQVTTSETGDESCTLSIPLTDETALLWSENQVLRLWRSDTDYEEWIVRQIAKTRDQGGRVDLTCGPVTYRLAECGYVAEWQTTDPAGDPLLEVGVSQTTLSDLFTTYLVDNTKLNTIIPWLGVGTLDAPFDTVTFDFEWSFASPQQFINDAVTAAQAAAGVPALWRLERNGSTGYSIRVRNVG